MLIIKGRGGGQFDRLYPPQAKRKTVFGFPLDFQRKRVYRAEHEVEGVRPFLVQGSSPTDTNRAIEAFLTGSESDPTLCRLFGEVTATVDIKYSRIACSRVVDNGVLLCVRSNGISAYEILHEVAHVIQGNSAPVHGQRFATILLVLVKQIMGDKYYRALVCQFNKHRVRYKTINGEAIYEKNDPKRSLGDEGAGTRKGTKRGVGWSMRPLWIQSFSR